MAQKSLFWSTGSTGDGLTTYTQTEILDWLTRTFLVDTTIQGVVAGYLNKLAVSGTASPISIASGAAVVAGIPYSNSTSTTLTIATPTTGTTGHRIVLRADYTAQTVRVVDIASSDGTSAIPALTQSAGSVWDISLASLTITTGGVITVTDLRNYIYPHGPLYYRQGGSSTVWSTAGTTNQSVNTAVKIEFGVIALSVGVATDITFPSAFSQAPIIFFSPVPVLNSLSASVANVTSNFSGTTNISWMAIGPV
jgi:hypothetical protein